MAGNTFGYLFRLTTFGESHGPALGGVIDGCPSGLDIDMDYIQCEMDRRRPGQSHITTQRKETDTVEFLSGIFEGKTTGAPIGFIIRNTDQKPGDYEEMKDKFRPSHADYTYHVKYGNRDWRGGGRSSARETACRVAGGAIAKLLLKKHQISIAGFVSQVGDIKLLKDYKQLDLSKTYESIVRCPDPLMAEMMIHKIESVRKDGDTVGGVVMCVIAGVPSGIGEPVFDKLHSDIGKAMLSINAVKGFEIGSGFAGTEMRGSEHNDNFYLAPNTSQKRERLKIRTKTNFSGGVQGGISNGEDIYFRVAFKPVSTIMKKQNTVDVHGNEVEIMGKGRHDPCVLPRAVSVVEAMAALVMVEHLMRNRSGCE